MSGSTSDINVEKKNVVPLSPFNGDGNLPPGIHESSLDSLRSLLCFNSHRRDMWMALASFLSLPALTRKFSYAYLGGGFISLKKEPQDIDIVLETIQSYGPEAFAAISRFFLVGLKRIEELYGVHLHFWMKDAPPGLSDFRAFFQYEKAESQSPVFNPTKGIFRIDLQAPDILSTLRRQIVRSEPLILTPEEILPDIDPRDRREQRLVAIVQKLSLAVNLEAIIDIVRQEARALLRADGATFVLRDGARCYYVDEDAISPLWKGQRFAMSTCISGWVMENHLATAITDIQKDDRIPLAAYRPTFVKSLLMAPIRSQSPIGAIGIYWAQIHEASQLEVELVQALANCTAVAMQNVDLRNKLEILVSEHQGQLESAKRELKSFSNNLSNDFRRSLEKVVTTNRKS